MIQLIAYLVESSRTERQLMLSQNDYAVLVAGKGFPFLFQQIRDSINLQQTRNLIFSLTRFNSRLAEQVGYCLVYEDMTSFLAIEIWEKVYFRSQILERPSIEEYWNISGVPVLPENVIFAFFRMCQCYLEAHNTGTQKWSSTFQYLCTSIWDLKYTFPKMHQKLQNILVPGGKF